MKYIFCRSIVKKCKKCKASPFVLQAKDSWETTPEEKMSLALHHKAKGTDCFKVENPLRLNFNWHTCIYISPATHTCIATCIFICTFETEP